MNNEFKQNKYQVIKQAISYDLANFCFNYLLLKRDAANFMYSNNIIADTGMWGTWKDAQVPGVYSHYADPVMETLLMKVLPVMKEQTGLDLIPTYSYTRVYTKGSILWRHKDRPSCEISTTLNLGGDHEWPIYINPKQEEGGHNETTGEYMPSKSKGVKVNLKPGDMLVYRGDLLEHWREPYTGNYCAQVFLHYNDVKTPGAEENALDKRPHLGLPSKFKRIEKKIPR